MKPEAAGIGSDVFELMCRCIITARTLGEALRLAQRYDKLLRPLVQELDRPNAQGLSGPDAVLDRAEARIGGTTNRSETVRR